MELLHLEALGFNTDTWILRSCIFSMAPYPGLSAGIVCVLSLL